MNQLPGDVKRLLSTAELPASVREIPAQLNPIAKGIFMAHQRQWVADRSDLKLCEKGRRTGITWAEAHDDTITAASSRAAGGDNVYYIGDTKEKGLEFIGYCAHFARVLATAMADDYMGIEVILFEDQLPDGSTRQITSYRIRFASGFEIVALSSRPENIRGLQGIVVIDEAAFHQDVDGVINAANALIIWGGKIRIISTHNGYHNPFNQLIQDTKRGEYDYSLHRYTFDDAVENGLYERVCFVKGKKPSKKGKKAWYQKVRRTYGNRIAQMREELDAIPQEGQGTAISSILAEACANKAHKVIRWSLPSEWVHKSPNERHNLAKDWINEYLDPLLDDLLAEHTNEQFWFGQDFARHRDFTVFGIIYKDIDLTRVVPITVELHNVPIKQQEEILWHTLDRLPILAGGGMDATGPGMTLAEYTADRYGHDRIQQIMLNNRWYSDNMGHTQLAFEQGTIEIPRDKNIISDITQLRIVDGIIKPPALRVKDLKDPDKYRHADAAIAYALGYFSTFQDAPFEIDIDILDKVEIDNNAAYGITPLADYHDY